MAALTLMPLPVLAQATASELTAAIRDGDANSRDVRRVYAERGDRPLWIDDGAVGPAAAALIELIETAALDGLDPDEYRPRALRSAIQRAASGRAKDLARAELALSRSFVQLASDMRRPRNVGIVYADAELSPQVPTPRELLAAAAAAPSLAEHVARIGWMNPVYAQLRRAAVAHVDAAGGSDGGEPASWRQIRVNLDRARALPAIRGRFVLVDAAAARLWMYDEGRVQGTMRVVVGKPSEPTPMMTALIRYASVNPYWNIPPDLVRLRVAPGAIDRGAAFLKAKRFEVLSGWTDDARVVPASTIDWPAVADGRVEARVRQLPGPGNAMGRIKFMFPNDLGIYLHDTPEKALLREDDRLFSSGCVRLEDAPRLARWLFGRPVAMGGTARERRVDLPAPVPVYITYLTAAADGDALVFRPDVYGRDDAQIAALAR